MRMHRIAVAVLVVALVAAGCKSSSGSKPDESLTGAGAQVPEYFHEIPADSFYVYAGLEPVPEDVVRSNLEGGERSLFMSYLEMVKESPGSSSFSKVASAILKEVDGELDAEGLQKLGFSMNPEAAIYGVGAMPIFRMKLGDPEAFKGTLNRIETEVEADVRMKERKGTTYRLYSDDEWHVPVVIRDGALVVAAYHEKASDVLLPYVLGEREPEKSLADSGALRKIVDSYDYKPYGAGYVDIRGLVRTMTGVKKPNAPTKAVFEATDYEVETASATCKEEIEAVTDRAPRLVFGTTEFTADRVEAEVGVELDDELASEFAGLTNAVPGVDTELFSNAMFALGFGVDIDRWTTMMSEHAESIAETPYECDKLQQLNKWAMEYKNRPIPTVVSQMKGAAFVLKDASFQAGQFRPKKLQAMALVRMNNPQTLIGRLQTVVPGLGQANVKDDGVPVPLEKVGQRIPFLEAPHVALKGKTLGFSAGVGMQDEMGALLENPASDATQTAAAMSYDLDKMRAAIPDQFKKMFTQRAGDGVLASTLTGGGELRLMFRKSGIFLRTRSKRESTGKESSSGGTEASAPSPSSPAKSSRRASGQTSAP